MKIKFLEFDLKQLLLAIDQLFNTLIWVSDDGFGYADETISARAWRFRDESNVYKIIDIIFFWNKNHCEQSYQAEVERKQLPNVYRN